MKNFTRKFIGLLTTAFTLCISQLFAQSTLEFNYTGAVQQWEVPCGVTEIQVDAYGASGTTSITGYFGNDNLGKGGRVEATLSVTPGQVLNVYAGGSSHFTGYSSQKVAGWNGGGGTQGGYAGGGATDIRIDGNELTDRILVAGGAGGRPNYSGACGGHGGGLVADDGCAGYSNEVAGAGKGGSQDSGGAGAYYWGGADYYTSPGGFGNGTGGVNSSGWYGGGGGGGWYGGSGGGSGGGGGGSSYTHPNLASNVIHTKGVQTGPGSLTISYTVGDLGSCFVDECGVMNGDNSSCSDECGVPNGDNSSCSDECGVPNGSGSYNYYIDNDSDDLGEGDLITTCTDLNQQYCGTLSVSSGSYASEVSWNIQGSSGTVANGGAPYSAEICLNLGDYTVNMIDSYGDGWNGSSLSFSGSSFTLPSGSSSSGSLSINEGNQISSLYVTNGDDICLDDPENDADGDGVCSIDEVLGCQEEGACNYNPLATEANESCEYTTCLDECGVVNGDNTTCLDECGVVNGDNTTCLDECGVINGDNSSCSDECGVINGDNSSCLDDCDVPNGDNSSCAGCTDETAINFDLNASINDGSCIPVVQGCLDPNASNYNEQANTDDSSCLTWEAFATELEILIAGIIPEDGISQVDVDAAYTSGAASVTPEDGITQSDVDVATPLSLNIPLSLPEGWSMFGYTCIESIDVIEGLSEFVNDIAIVKDDMGLSYLPDWNFNAIGSFEYSHGYQIKLTESIDNLYFCTTLVNKIFGCTDSTAFNFNADANTDDNNCIATIEGCTDDTAFNFDLNANTDNESCINSIYGCMDESSCNYEANANTEDVCTSFTLSQSELYSTETLYLTQTSPFGEGLMYDAIPLILNTCLDGDNDANGYLYNGFAYRNNFIVSYDPSTNSITVDNYDDANCTEYANSFSLSETLEPVVEGTSFEVSNDVLYLTQTSPFGEGLMYDAIPLILNTCLDGDNDANGYLYNGFAYRNNFIVSYDPSTNSITVDNYDDANCMEYANSFSLSETLEPVVEGTSFEIISESISHIVYNAVPLPLNTCIDEDNDPNGYLYNGFGNRNNFIVSYDSSTNSITVDNYDDANCMEYANSFSLSEETSDIGSTSFGCE